MHYFLIAGEASGDLHAAPLIERLRKHDPEARFTFLGGDLMASAAGCAPLIHYRDMAFMGFSEVLRHLRTILGNLKRAKKAIAETRPDALILIDYPSFNLKIAKYAHRLGIPVNYYISPKVWAWKEWRVKSIRRYVDRMFTIFPFETEFYRKHGYEVTYVGNPSVAEVEEALAAAPTRDDFLREHRLRDRPILALLPGSRRGEIRRNLPLMLAAAAQFPQYPPVVAGAPGIEPEYYAGFTDKPVVYGQTMALLRHARGALVTSGTATLETAIARVPQVVCYRANGSKLTYNLMKRVLKIQHVSLPNLIADREIIPEMLLHLCTPDAVAEQIAPVLPDGEGRARMLADYEDMADRLGHHDAPDTVARAIVDDLRREQQIPENYFLTTDLHD